MSWLETITPSGVDLLTLRHNQVACVPFLYVGAQVVGVIMAIAGLMMWVKAAKGKGRHSHERAMFCIVLGSLMLFVPMVMGVDASTLLGGQ